MKPEITDISYSTALTFELVTQYGFLTLGAPIFPSLRKESIYQTDMNAKSILLFFQYKLSEHIVGVASSLQADWGVPYYRFLVHPKNKNKRHEVLLHLEDMNHLAYYVAPEFHTKSKLYEFLMQKALLTHSTFWSPRQIGSLSPAERNVLSYKRDSSFGMLEPGKRKISGALKGDALLNEIKSRFESSAETYDNDRFVRLGDQMLENYLKVFHAPKEKRLTSDIWKSRDLIDSRDYLSLISILLYDCYVYIIAK
ncbi:MAG: hypothetical protein PHQ36_02635 [Anaerolineales bacterium]|nr:hypothetical protein [Anaerolineales bacterium]